ncbi:MAG: ATP-binding cassette domain-containing protein [Methanobacteriaceae archaeon]|nr:ATP-binding cassette domain-containing protein [Methanobacteriaceae archaeon]MDD3408477.1 ATP-binding cassette domain-containing protein [Methanobacteriaceae archaeon]
MILEIKDYSKKIKKKQILNNINLRLESGNVYGFFGRNGSGKTMLFRAITSLIYPTSGDVIINNKSIIYDDFDLSKIGLLLEEPGFYPHLTGTENLSMLYEINNKKNLNYMKKVMKKVGLEEEQPEKYREYSLGMKQKLRIGQAIMENQELIILDEPTNGLDEVSIDNIHKIIKELKDQNKLILIASHNKDDLRLLCDKIFRIEQGKIVGEIKI